MEFHKDNQSETQSVRTPVITSRIKCFLFPSLLFYLVWNGETTQGTRSTYKQTHTYISPPKFSTNGNRKQPGRENINTKQLNYQFISAFQYTFFLILAIVAVSKVKYATLRILRRKNPQFTKTTKGTI